MIYASTANERSKYVVDEGANFHKQDRYKEEENWCSNRRKTSMTVFCECIHKKSKHNYYLDGGSFSI